MIDPTPFVIIIILFNIRFLLSPLTASSCALSIVLQLPIIATLHTNLCLPLRCHCLGTFILPNAPRNLDTPCLELLLVLLANLWQCT